MPDMEAECKGFGWSGLSAKRGLTPFCESARLLVFWPVGPVRAVLKARLLPLSGQLRTNLGDYLLIVVSYRIGLMGIRAFQKAPLRIDKTIFEVSRCISPVSQSLGEAIDYLADIVIIKH